MAASTPIKYADLATVSLLDLLENKKSARDTLLHSGKQDGFFYLDIRTTQSPHLPGSPLLTWMPAIFDFSKALFDLPIHAKMEFDVDKVSPLKLNGYKPLGRNKIKDSDARDGFESYAVSRM
jgi:hypothetical protein